MGYHRLQYCKSDGNISSIWSNLIPSTKTLLWPDSILEPHACQVSAIPTSPRGFCWKIGLCLATCSMPVDIFVQISEDLRLNWDRTCNFTICNLHLAETASYFVVFPRENDNNSEASYGGNWFEIICIFTDHKNAASIENMNPKMLENFRYIIIALLYLKNMSFHRRKTQKVRNRQIRICSAITFVFQNSIHNFFSYKGIDTT